ncbi:MAG TPA: hypothetical protein VFF06_11275, partial [Polyangia bacterium]|nr:hypothetical protein [Polyangia bacterium]
MERAIGIAGIFVSLATGALSIAASESKTLKPYVVSMLVFAGLCFLVSVIVLVHAAFKKGSRVHPEWEKAFAVDNSVQQVLETLERGGDFTPDEFRRA